MEIENIGFGNNVEGFTPVRRRLSTINARQSQIDSEKEWTAARCNRLLRALKSRVAILNKDLSRIQPSGQGREIAVEVKTGTIRSADQEMEWTQARKRIKLTYSTRGGRSRNDSQRDSLDSRTPMARKGVKAFIPGEVSVPTPILNRTRRGTVSINSSAVPIEVTDGPEVKINKRTKVKDYKSKSQLSQTLRDIRKQTPASRYTIYEGIYNGLEALLKATTPEEPQKNRGGPKSLLSLCLQAVPRYITQEENIFVAHIEKTGSKSAIDNRDVSTEIYNDLEAFGSNGRGWKPFMIIVRSHGIQVISDAIRARSFDNDFVGILITLCIHTNAVKEAETLLSTLLSTANFPRPRNVFTRFGDDPATRPLSMLWKFVEITGNNSFQYRQLSKLVSDGLLPLSWLASKELGPVWTRSIQDLSCGSTKIEAFAFMDTMVPILGRLGDLCYEEELSAKGGDCVMLNAMKQTFSSLLTTLSSITILSKNSAERIPAQKLKLSTTEFEHPIILIRSYLIQWELSCVFNIQGTLLVITNLILKTIGRGNHPEVELVDLLLDHLRQVDKSTSILTPYNEIVLFICSIARCCGRGALNSGFEHLKYLHQTLENLICDRVSDRANVLREIISDSALAFAQEAPDPKHLDYAATMEGRVHRIETKPSVNLRPELSLDNFGFRWEEGISEWVVATPSAGNCKELMTFPPTGLSLCETPFRPPVRRGFQNQAPFNMRARAPQPSASIVTINDKNEPIVSSPISGSPASEVDQEFGDKVLIEFSPGIRHKYHGEPKDDALQADLPIGSDTSGDELALGSIEEGPSNDEGNSRDELQSNSPQFNSSISSHQQNPSPRGEHSLVAEYFTSVASPAISWERSEVDTGRRCIDRVPRVSKKILRRSLQWQLYDESDDELSFTSVSSDSKCILRDVTNSVRPSTGRRCSKKALAKERKSLYAFNCSLLADSEDELCI